MGVITKEVDESTSSVRNDIDKNYEDVSNMLKRMRMRREELVERRGAAAEKAHVQPIDGEEEEEEEEEGYIEMTEAAAAKQPVYERVRFPRQTPPKQPLPPTPAAPSAGNFSHSDSIDSVEYISDVEYNPVWSKSYRRWIEGNESNDIDHFRSWKINTRLTTRC